MNIIIIGIGNIGFEVAKKLINDNSILLVARNLPDYVADFIANNKNIYFSQGDATSIHEMGKIRDSEIIKSFGQVDLIICTPGTTSDSTPLNDFNGFRKSFNANYFANIIPLKVFSSEVLLKNGGKIIVLSASSGHHADKRLSGYPASKWALENTYSSLREEVRARNISVDVIAVRTIKNKYSKVWTQNYGEDPENIARFIKKIILKPQNKRHFLPKKYSIIRLIERLFPIILDYKHGLKNTRKRKKAFKKGDNNIVLITGAASGLGKALSYTYSKTAKILYLCDKNINELELLKKELMTSSKCIIDIAKVNLLSEEEIINYSKNIKHVDLLINNAGVRYMGTIDKTAIETFKENFEINFFSPILLMSIFFNKKTQPNKIINILSTTAIRGRAMMSLYSSAKAALWNYTRSFRRVYGNAIQIVEVIPSGMSMTKLLENSINGEYIEKKTTDLEKKKSTLQSKVKFLHVTNWSAFDAAERIQLLESKGREIIYIPPVKAKLFLILEATSDWLFSRIFKS